MGADAAKDGSSQWGLILQKADCRGGADLAKSGSPQEGRSRKEQIRCEAVHPFASILLRILLVAMLQFA